jgi:hypothetical protein
MISPPEPQQTPSSSAASKAFHSDKIFYAILDELPIRQLLLVQRVSHHWETFITHSTKHQELLFLSPRAPQLLWDPVCRSKTARPEHYELVRIDGDPPADATDSPVWGATINPLIFPAAFHKPIAEYCLCKASCRNAHEDLLLQPFLFLEPDACVRDMFLTQPPVRTVTFGLSGQGSEAPEWNGRLGEHHCLPYAHLRQNGAVYVDSGVTLEDLLQKIWEIREKTNNYAMWCCVRFENMLFPNRKEAELTTILGPST